MEEVHKVLKPNGTFTHFQVNYPSDDTVKEDNSNLVFFPARYDRHTRTQMVGMTKENLIKGIFTIKTLPFRKILENFLEDPEEAYIQLISSPNALRYVDMLRSLLDAMFVDRMVIPSPPDYFKSKLEDATIKAGLTIVESGFRGTSIRTKRSPAQMRFPQYNQFSLEQGSTLFTTNLELEITGSRDVIEKASLLVFVAKKSTQFN